MSLCAFVCLFSCLGFAGLVVCGGLCFSRNSGRFQPRFLPMLFTPLLSPPPPDSDDVSVGPFVIILQVFEHLCLLHPRSTFCEVGKFYRSSLEVTDCFPCVSLLLSPSRWCFMDRTFQLYRLHLVVPCDFCSFVVIFFNSFRGNL